MSTAAPASASDGLWTRTAADGAQKPIASLSPDALDRLEQSPAWKELCALADQQITEFKTAVFDEKTPDADANVLRKAVAKANQVTPQALLKMLRVRHPRR